MIISVSQFNNFLKGVIDSEPILGDISVRGEISNYKENYDSLYFCLRDNNSQMECFAYQKQVGGGFSNGMTVVAQGSAVYLTKFGKMSFTVRKITAENSLGEKYKRLLELKAKLESEGIFADEHKVRVPNDCKRIGVVTSATGAVIHDIVTVVTRRNPSVDIVLFPVKVQGAGAEFEIKNGIEYFSHNGGVDAVIVGRGGGSDEDLSAFNTEIVARAIFNSGVPIVSAVGHNTDFTFADFAADKRAATPSEAAEFVSVDVVSEKRLAKSLLARISALTKDKLDYYVQSVGYRAANAYAAANKTIFSIENKVIGITKTLEANNPTKILTRGLTQICKEDKIVKNVGDISVGDSINFELVGGKATATVSSVKVKK